MESIVGKRLRAARDQAGMTQRELSDRLGIKDRQTVAAIEAGQRKLTAEELIAVVRILGRDLDYFTDPFRLDGEGRFSWRTSAEDATGVAEFESQAGRWLATFRQLVPGAESRTVPLRLDLTKRSSFEEAHAAAEWLGREWRLGEAPALKLETAIRERLQALVLYVDAPSNVSGAAVKLPGLSAILINRHEPIGRCNFDLAHELFHILTWETMPPAHAELRDVPPAKAKRVEQLADCFASALLMPDRMVRKKWRRAPALGESAWTDWLNESARQFRVSTIAFQWRLVALQLLEKDAVDRSAHWYDDDETASIPELFSRDLAEAVNRAIDHGTLSVRRAAALLELSIDEMASLLSSYGIEPAFDM